MALKSTFLLFAIVFTCVASNSLESSNRISIKNAWKSFGRATVFPFQSLANVIENGLTKLNNADNFSNNLNGYASRLVYKSDVYTNFTLALDQLAESLSEIPSLNSIVEPLQIASQSASSASDDLKFFVRGLNVWNAKLNKLSKPTATTMLVPKQIVNNLIYAVKMYEQSLKEISNQFNTCSLSLSSFGQSFVETSNNLEKLSKRFKSMAQVVNYILTHSSQYLIKSNSVCCYDTNLVGFASNLYTVFDDSAKLYQQISQIMNSIA